MHVDDVQNVDSLLMLCGQYARKELVSSLSRITKGTNEFEVIENSSDINFHNESSLLTINYLYKIGLGTDDYYSANESVVYAIAYLKKDKLIKKFHNKISKSIAKVSQIIRKSSEEQLNYKEYLNGLTILNQASGYSKVLLNLGVESEFLIRQKEQLSYKVALNQRLNDVKKKYLNNLDNSLEILINQLSLVNDIDSELYVIPITFENKDVTTPFSAYFDKIFTRKLASEFEISDIPVENRISGTYWTSRDRIQIAINVHKYRGEEPYKLLGGESLEVNREYVSELGIEYEYENTPENSSLDKMAINTSRGGLVTNLQTNKGTQGLYFEEDEEIKFYIKVSRPSYIQLINIWSDGTQISLLDGNYYIDESKVNTFIELPFTWTTQCPCGYELVKLYAQKHPFLPLNTSNKEGLDYIQSSVSATIKQARSEKEKNEYFGESSLRITTIKPIKQ